MLLYIKRAELSALPPNAWGDFFAGCFAPLAFLWLVLGYLQQGEELSLSTRALLLQAEELKQSVEQQRALVEVSRLQVEGERAALECERQFREEQARPKLIAVHSGGSFRGDGHSTYDCLVTNIGATVTSLLGQLSLPDGSLRTIVEAPIVEQGAQVRVAFSLAEPFPEAGVLRITYRDTLGRDGVAILAVSRKDSHPHSGLLFEHESS